MPLCTTCRVHDEFRPNRERRNGREKERIHGSARTGQREGMVRVCVYRREGTEHSRVGAPLERLTI